MDAERWTRVRALFEGLVELDDDEREALLVRESVTDPEIAARVRSLLDADRRKRTPVEDAVPAVLELLRPRDLLAELAGVADPDASSTGLSVEPYRIVRLIGRGGMGAVYLAERADGAFERSVAIKLVRRGADSGEILRRFRDERRILAALEHPNIARLYDAGVASDGRPFLVMEHVEGERIDRWAERASLGLRGCVELVVQVCEAVAHAHQSLVIHRDLKPSNILVAADGSVKLLDFGIAKLAPDADDEPATRTALGPLTPEYASPEQLRGEVLSTATDVYALGAVLYEILTGARPFPDAHAALEHAFRDDPAAGAIPPPSRRLAAGRAGSSAAARATSSASHGPPARPWARELRGDLDRITLKALARDPQDRYEGVGALAEDLRRWLDGRPVLAQPPSAAYRMRKFVRRHRAGVALGSIAVLGLVGTTATAVVQARHAAVERDTAQGVSTFLEDLFRASDPRAGHVADTTRMADFLEVAATRVRDELADQPATRARLLYVLGSIYRTMSRLDLAMPLFRDAIAANRDVHGPGHVDEVQARELLGLSLVETGSFDEGLAQLDSALTLEVAAEGEDAMITWRLRERLGQAYATAQRNEEALPHLAAVVAATRTAEPFEPARLASALNTYGSVLGQMGRVEEAVPLLAEAADLTAEANPSLEDGPRALDEAVQRANLAFMLMRLTRLDDAEREMRRSLALLEGRLPAEHQLRGQSAIRMAQILDARRQASGEDELIEEIDSLYAYGLGVVRGLPQLRGSVFFTASSYGRALRGWGRLDEAERMMLEAVTAGTETLGSDHPLVWTARSDLGRIVAERGRLAEGLEMTDDALTALRAMRSAQASARVNAATNRGRVLLMAGRPADAEMVLEAARVEAVDAFPPEHPMRGTIEELLAEAHER